MRRSSTDRLLGGVCGGLAVAGGAGFLVYLLLWVLMRPGPQGPNPKLGPVDRVAEQVHGKVYASRWMTPPS